MKIRLLLVLLTIGTSLCAQSSYETEFFAPSYDATNDEMFLITTTNNGWSRINDPSINYFYVAPGDYRQLNNQGLNTNTINVRTSGTFSDKKHILLFNQNNEHPGKLPNSEQALVAFDIEADYWVIDRMSFALDVNDANTYYAYTFQNADNNVVNRAYTLNTGGVIIRDNCNANVIQNCRMEILNSSVNEDRAAIALINYRNGSTPASNVRISNTRILSNEIYNHVDGFQAVVQNSIPVSNVNFEGTIIDHNQIYIDDSRYTNCAGSLVSSGSCARSENAIDLKAGSRNAANPFTVTNNRMWGYRKSDSFQSNLDDPGTAVVFHFGVNNLIFEDNVIFDSTRGISIADNNINFTDYPRRSLLNTSIKRNIVYDISGFGIVCQGSSNVTFEGNLFKDISSNDDFWAEFNKNDNVDGNENLSFRFNRILNCYGNTTDFEWITNPSSSNNTYFNAVFDTFPIGSISNNDPSANYGDLVFTSDSYTNSPNIMSLPKVLPPLTVTDIFIEAECPNVISEYWASNNSASASNDMELTSQSGVRDLNRVLGNESTVTYNFDVFSSGMYYLASRFRVTNNADSFWISVNDGAWTVWQTRPAAGFTWISNRNISALYLSQGSNKIEVALREGGLILDKFALMTSDTLPDGVNGIASNCTVLSTDGNFERDEEQSTIGLFPNPAYDIINISLSDELVIGYNLLSMNDKLMQSGCPIHPSHSYAISTDKLIGGTYILQIVTKQNIYFRKFVKL